MLKRIAVPLEGARELSRKLHAIYDEISYNHLTGLEPDLQLDEPLQADALSIDLGDGATLNATPESYNAALLISLLAAAGDKSVMIWGAPGTGKTTLVTLLARALAVPSDKVFDGILTGNSEFSEDNFAHPDMKSIIKESEYKIAWKAFASAPVRMVDELTRISGYGQSQLGMALSEHRLQYHGESIPIETAPFFGAANTVKSGETFGLTDHMRSRFDMHVLMTMASALNATSNTSFKYYPDDPNFQLSPNDKQRLRQLVDLIKKQPWAQILIDEMAAVIDRANTLPAGRVVNKSQLFMGETTEAVAKQLMDSNPTGLVAEKWPQLQFNESISPRELQAWAWFTLALAIMTAPENPEHAAEQIAPSILPYLLYMNVLPNEIAIKANNDQPITEPMHWVKSVSRQLWEQEQSIKGEELTCSELDDVLPGKTPPTPTAADHPVFHTIYGVKQYFRDNPLLSIPEKKMVIKRTLEAISKDKRKRHHAVALVRMWDHVSIQNRALERNFEKDFEKPDTHA